MRVSVLQIFFSMLLGTTVLGCTYDQMLGCESCTSNCNNLCSSPAGGEGNGSSGACVGCFAACDSSCGGCNYSDLPSCSSCGGYWLNNGSTGLGQCNGSDDVCSTCKDLGDGTSNYCDDLDCGGDDGTGKCKDTVPEYAGCYCAY